MSAFANAGQFAGPESFLAASGANSTIVDPRGNVIAHVMTGGMIAPQRYEIASGTVLFRFGASGASPFDVAQGRWWVEKQSFEKLLSFANAYDISVGMAARV